MKFIPTRPLQTVSSPSCALVLIERRKAKQQAHVAKMERADIKARKLELKPIQWFQKKAQTAFNAYIRDGRDKDKPCVACGVWDASEWHCGHFISVGASSATRYTETNVGKVCSKCNTHLAGNLLEMEKGLVILFGQEEVDRLKNAPRSRKWDRAELQAIEQEYKAKLKAYQA